VEATNSCSSTSPPNTEIGWVAALVEEARLGKGVDSNAVFGDCGPVSRDLIPLLMGRGVTVRLAHGIFVSNPEEEEQWDHSWVELDIDGKTYILDPTVDQFFSPLDVDLVLENEKFYFSHPDWDGDWLAERYQKW
jgi:hypothetical protein